MRHKKILLAAFAAANIALCAAFAGAQAVPVSAPVNPDFLKYIEAKKAGKTGTPAPTQHALGYMPSPVNARLYVGNGAKSSLSHGGSLPASYDLRLTGKLTGIRDQGQCGDCWAFATMGSLESYYMPTAYDFSEEDLNQNSGSGFTWAPCGGGNYYMSSAYLTRWAGPMMEGTSSPVVKHAQNIIFLTPRANSLDNDRIKNAIVTYGGVSVLFTITGGAEYLNSFSDSYYNAVTHAFYFNGSAATNHAVTIVGWNDNYAATNFSTAPPGNGAFICKNSWGSSWGESGYFYVSYYDTVFANADYSNVFTAEDAGNYTRVYGYDPLGWVQNYGFLGSPTTVWDANIFPTASDVEKLSAVGFYTPVEGAGYTINVYTGVNSTTDPTAGTLVSTISGTLSEAGYHTIPLVDTVYLLGTGTKFSIVVHVTNASTTPLVVSNTWTGYATTTSSPGRGFYSNNGTTWTDIYNWDNSANICVKAYTTVPDSDWVAKIKAYPSPGRLAQGDKIYFHNVDVHAPSVDIYIYSVSGRLVRHLTEAAGDIAVSGAEKLGVWDGKNGSGDKVASGVYVYVAKCGTSTKTGKVGVIW